MMTTKYKLHIAECSMLIALSISLCLALWGQAEQTALAEDLVRLHVIAHSDDEYEQALKLRVRDAVLASAESILENAENARDARILLSENLDALKQAAESTSEGRQVEITLTEESYPTRVYGGFSLPAGKYVSLRILLGSAQGQNWWCVVFPPLCTTATAENAEAVLGKENAALITRESPSYVLKFRSIELWDELRNTIIGN